MRKKILSVAVSVFVLGGVLQANDDVSIMDLKEGVYILMHSVKDLRAEQREFIDKSEKIINRDRQKIVALENEIAKLKEEIEALRNRDVLGKNDAKMPKELLEYLKK